MTREEVVARLEAAGFVSGPDGLSPPRRSDFDLLPDGRPAFANGRALKPAGVLVALGSARATQLAGGGGGVPSKQVVISRIM